jgi:hypothetical protein
MKLSSIMLVAACIAMLVTKGHAQTLSPNFFASANYVMPGCRAAIANSEPDDFKQGVCLGTIYGLGSGLRILQDLREAGVKVSPEICMPKEVTLGQQLRIVAAYVDARPNRLHEDFRDLAWEALKDAWQCKR